LRRVCRSKSVCPAWFCPDITILVWGANNLKQFAHNKWIWHVHLNEMKMLETYFSCPLIHAWQKYGLLNIAIITEPIVICPHIIVQVGGANLIYFHIYHRIYTESTWSEVQYTMCVHSAQCKIITIVLTGLVGQPWFYPHIMIQICRTYSLLFISDKIEIKLEECQLH